MILVVKTQYMENYGAHDWNGLGVCPQRWKYKGGSEYKIRNTPANLSNAEYARLISSADIARDNEYCREYVMEWSIESDDYKSWFEKSQLEHDGSITYAEPEFDYLELTLLNT